MRLNDKTIHWVSRRNASHTRKISFTLARDPRFEHKLVDVAGLCFNPPENAIILSRDEKRPIQALNTLDGTVIAMRLSMQQRQFG